MSDLAEVRVADISEIAIGASLEVVVAGRIVALFNVDGTIHALDGLCPHAGGPLGQGQLSGCLVTCPWHGWQFDVTSGQHSLTQNIVHERFDVRVEGTDVLVQLPRE